MNLNYWLLYPLAMMELGAMSGAQETAENLLKRCVVSLIYAKVIKSGKELNDINPVSKAKLTQIGEHRYE